MKSQYGAALMVVLCLTLPVAIAGASEAGNRTSVDITVYNQDLSLVREVRTMDLQKGLSTIVVSQVPATIDGASIHFRSRTSPESVRVLEQNYQYDLVHHAKILEKYVGKEIQFIRVNSETNKEYMVSGKLLSTGYLMQPSYGSGPVNYVGMGGMVAEIGGQIEINPVGRIVLPGLPGGLILRPQLEWLMESSEQGRHETEISYLAGQVSWSCDYVAVLSANDRNLGLTGWVTLTNNSGTTFENAGLKLVAGDVNIVRNRMGMDLLSTGKAMSAEGQQQFEQTDLFEFKLYTLKRRTDLKTNETKQIELVSGNDVPAKKVFIYDGLEQQWRSWYRNSSYRSHATLGQQSNPKVGVYVIFPNNQKSGLGIPLPKGRVRVYKEDDDGKEQFVGEDLIDHTAKDEEVRLYLGNAFDIVGERVQKDFRSLASASVVEETIEIKVRNHKKEEVEVLVYEHPWRWGEWEIVKTGADWEKTDQSTIKFPLTIPKDGEKVITYTIRYSW